MGDDGVVIKLGGLLRRPNVVGDVTWIKGEVAKKWIEKENADGECRHLVRCKIWSENQLGEATMQGYAEIYLPSRSKPVCGHDR
jgi:hypothetical protein